MGMGILVCGLNGAGKSTLGKMLAQRLNFYWIDNEELFFPVADPQYRYAHPRTKEEAVQAFGEKIHAHENFVFAAVKGDYGEEAYPLFKCAVLIEADKETRMERIRNRSYEKFGERMLPGGDLYQQEESFFDFARRKEENTVEEWLKVLSCPIIRVDGTKGLDENLELIIKELQRRFPQLQEV